MRQRLTRRRMGAAAGATFAMWLGAAAAQVSSPTAVEQTNLARDAFSTGVLGAGDGALSSDLWRGADVDTLSFLLAHAPARPETPSLGEALRRVLLTPGAGPDGAPASLGGRKLRALAAAGYVEEARTLASLSSAPRNDPHVGEALAVADLLSGDAQAACARNAALTSGRDAAFWVKLRVYCYAVAGERDAADLSLGILRERGALSETDDALLTAIVAGVSPKAPPSPENALHLAAVRRLQSPLSPSLLADANAGVLTSVAADAALDGATRADAAMRAAAMGVMTPQALASVFNSLDINLDDLGRAGEAAAARPHDPLADVLLYRSIGQMSAPEFLRDKAARIAEALSRGKTFERAYSLSALYADDIATLEGALLPADEAIAFARARMIVGDGEGASRWLYAALGEQSIAALDEPTAMSMIELTNFLAVLDPPAAAAVGAAADIAIEPPYRRDVGGGLATDVDAMARVVDAAFDAASGGVSGQAALAALAASTLAPPEDPLAQVVISQSLKAAGLDDVRRRRDFEAVLKTRFRSAAPADDPSGLVADSAGDVFRPSLKPKRDQ
ncbi:MAG: hypothetical protein AAGJ87_03535 [Pseudomonadota bacterium]